MSFFKNKIPLLIVFFALNFISASLLAIEISVRPDRNPVNLNESVQITFSANDEPDGEPDFSPLEQDFNILNRAQHQSTQIVNWKSTKSYQWVLTVMAKRTGNLLIPAINFGKDSSQFSSLLVNKVQVTSNTAEDLFLLVEVNNTQPYIQQQVIYTLKLYRKVNITQWKLKEPEFENAIVERLSESEGKSFKTQHQGENYIVTEWKYSIFPQKSGSMTIPPSIYLADVIIASQRRSNSLFNRQNTHTKRVASKAIMLEVQAKPENASRKDWLPAKQVFLQEKWSDTAVQMTVGEPSTRTITLFVEGATVGALPELYKNNLPAHLKAYPDQPVLKEEARETGMVALREEKIAMIPGQAGEYTLPAIEVTWWNTETRQLEVARIAERTITATVPTDSNQLVAPVPEIITSSPSLTTAVNSEAQNISALQNNQSLWFWLAIFFAVSWGVTLIYFLSRKAGSTKKGLHSVATEKMFAVDKQLRLACTENDPVMAKDALLQWGREQFSHSSLNKIAQQCDAGLQNEILSLNAVLYSNNTGVWQGSALWTAFKNNKSVTAEKDESLGPLQPLFKI